MKKLFKSTKISLASLFLFSMMVHAATTAPAVIVSQVQGNVFSMTNGKTKVLSVGDRISDFSDVVTEEGSQVTLTDYHDHKFHLAGSGHLRFERNQVSVERGYVWLQSFNQRDEFYVKTANSKIAYTLGEAVISFDSFSGKTQVMSVRGDFTLNNSLETHLKVTVADGQFSFVSNDYNQGIPRTPMSIGEGSFKKVTGLFNGVQPASPLYYDATAKNAPARSVASAPEKANKPSSGIVMLKGKTSFVNEKVIGNAYRKEEKKVADIKRRQYLKREYSTKSGVAVKIYGKSSGQKAVAKASTTASTAQRMPASAAPAELVKPDNSFESSMVKQYEGQMRHTNEVNKLIEELKNYEQDYQSGY